MGKNLGPDSSPDIRAFPVVTCNPPCVYTRHQVDIFPEALLGVLGLVDDLMVGLIFLVQATVIYRTILLSVDRAMAASTAAPSNESAFSRGARRIGTAAAAAIAVGTMATVVGAGAGVAQVAAVAAGAATAATIAMPEGNT